MILSIRRLKLWLLTTSVFLGLLCTGLLAQNRLDSPVNAHYANLIDVNSLKKNVFELASNDMEGRATATKGEQKAADYIIRFFSDYELTPGSNGIWKQKFAICQDSVAEVRFHLNNSKTYRLGTDFCYFNLFWNKSEQIKATDIVFAGYGISHSNYDDYATIDVNGKIVVIFDGQPMKNDSIYLLTGTTIADRRIGYKEKLEMAKKRGARMLLIINDLFAHREKGYSYKSACYVTDLNSQSIATDRINLFCISKKMASDLLGVSDVEQLKKSSNKLFKCLLSFNFKKSKVECGQAANIIAFLEGSDKKDEYVFITAHYDHRGKTNNGEIYYGADDNASGTAALMEISKVFSQAKKQGFGSRRSLVFIAMTGEESGLLGSEFYIRNPIYPLSKSVVDLNIDMVGRVGREYLDQQDSTNYVYTIGDDSLSSELKNISDSINKIFINLKLDNTDKDSYYKRSDHYHFAKNGIPIIFYTNGGHKDYHQITDTADKINYELLKKRAQLIFYTAWEIANRDKRIKMDKKIAR